uniref:Uncharacterized protein n=1 Tax=Glossina pallidipes TaxID=7398 RepID=A0A1A9Z6S3_GLOPL
MLDNVEELKKDLQNVQPQQRQQTIYLNTNNNYDKEHKYWHRKRKHQFVSEYNSQREQQQSVITILKTSIDERDSVGFVAGNVKCRPHSVTHSLTAPADNVTTTNYRPTISDTNRNHHTLPSYRPKAKGLKRQTIHEVSRQINIASEGNLENSSNMQKSSSTPKATNGGSTSSKEKPQKLRLSNKTSADRNANNSSISPTFTSAVGGTISKSRNNKKCNHCSTNKLSFNNFQDENYMEFEFFANEPTNQETAEFTELFCDFPVSYDTTHVLRGKDEDSNHLRTLPTYRDPAPPTPPPLSQLPSRSLLNQTVSVSCPSTPSRGKVVLSKKERKELIKSNKLKNIQTSGSASNIGGLESAETNSIPSNPYKGRVTELKNCIARINSKGLFASLHRSSQKSLTSQTSATEEQNSSAEVSPPPPAPENNPPSSNVANNNEADYSEKLKNLPVRQRKVHTSHMDNYCLFDPLDFVNEKTLKRSTPESMIMDINAQSLNHNLRDPLFSSRQHLTFSEEEDLVPEVIYNVNIEDNNEQLNEKIEISIKNFEHHNYFVIDPQKLKDEPLLDIGIPNPFSNEQFVQAQLLSAQHTYVNNLENMENMKSSESLDKLINDDFEAPTSMSNSQESKDTNTTTSNITTTNSIALEESSTSTNSNTSSSSNVSSQTALQGTKKKLTFLNLSPFCYQKSVELIKNEDLDNENLNIKSRERAISEVVSLDHVFHLQEMLMSADSTSKENKSRTVPIESNYVLFNPGPVPSRNVQYKVRKPRPLSTHSDADSGFLSPCSPPDEFSSLKFNPAILVLQQCDSVQGYIEVNIRELNFILFLCQWPGGRAGNNFCETVLILSNKNVTKNCDD